MNKERQVIKPGTIVFFNRNVNGAELESLSDKSLTVVICGDLFLEKYFRFNGNLYVEGNVNENQNIEINGDFICGGEINLKDIYIEGDFKAYNSSVNARNITVSGEFYAYSVDSHEITVNEFFYAEDVNSLDICVGGDFSCESIDANHADISVAGDFECRDGIERAGCITVLGKMNVDRTIEADTIKVGL